MCTTLANVSDDQLHPLTTDWLTGPSPRVRETTIRLAAALDAETALDVLRTHAPDNNPDMNAALAETLLIHAMNAPDAVLGMLQDWATHPDPPDWIIGEVLSGSWAAASSDTVLSLLEQLAQSPPAVRKVLKALIRHGEEAAVQTRLAAWQAGADPALQSIADTFNPDLD